MPFTRLDYQVTNNQLIFGRYLGAKISSPPSWTGPGDNILKTSLSAASSQLHSGVLGHTQVVSTSVVNAARFTYNYTKVQRYQPPGFFSPADVGVKMYSYPPANQFSLSVTNNFAIMAEYGLYVVADGMGGHASGEIASKMAVDTLHALFNAHPGEPA